MPFSVNTNLGALQAYNSLAKVNADTQKAQLRLATLKKINSVADDTSGYMVGKSLEAQTLKQKAQLNNVSSGNNFLATAETALQQINDKLNQISAKYVDSQDPLKNQGSIADDIRTLAGEIDSILKSTNINGHNLLASSDGSELGSSGTFDVSGAVFTVDFASNAYLNVGTIKSALHGSTVTDPGVASYNGSVVDLDNVIPDGSTSTLVATYADGTSDSFNVNLAGCADAADTWNKIYDTLPPAIGLSGNGNMHQYVATVTAFGQNITSFETTAGFDITTAFGMTRHAAPSGTTGGLMDSITTTVLNAASDVYAIANNIRSALGRIGNLSQTLISRSENLTASILNNTASISSIFDADMASEQLNATKGSIAGQIGTAMLSQLNSAPQQLLSLFR